MLKLFNLYRQIARQFSLENAIYESRERYGMRFSISLSSAKSLFIGSISMSVILRFSRQHFLSRPCEWKDRLEIPWPIFRLVSSLLDLFPWRISHKNPHCQVWFLNSNLPLYRFCFLCVRYCSIKERRGGASFHFFWSRRDIKESLGTAVLGRINLKSRI